MREQQLWFHIFRFLQLSDLIQVVKVNKKFNQFIKDFYSVSSYYSTKKRWLNVDCLIKECDYQQSDSIIVPNTFVRSLGLFFDIFFINDKIKIEFWSAFGTKRFILVNLPSDFKVGSNYVLTHLAPSWNEFEKVLVWCFKNYNLSVNCVDLTKIDAKFNKIQSFDDLEEHLIRSFQSLSSSQSLPEQFSISDNFNCELPNRFVYPIEDGFVKTELSSVGRGGTPLFDVVVEGCPVGSMNKRNQSKQSFRISASRIIPFGYENRFVLIPYYHRRAGSGLRIFDSTSSNETNIIDEYCYPNFITYNDIKRRLFVVTNDQVRVYQKENHHSEWIKSQVTEDELKYFYDKENRLFAKFVHFCPFTNEYISIFNQSKDSLTLDDWLRFVDPYLLKYKDLKQFQTGLEYQFVEINFSDMCEDFNVKPYKTLTPIDQMSHSKSVYVHDQGHHGLLNNKKFVFRRQTKTHDGFTSFKKIKTGQIIADDIHLGAMHNNRIIMESDFNKNVPQTLIEQRQFNVY